MSVDSPDSPFMLKVASIFSWFLGKSVASLNALGTMLIMAMMVLICSDVIGRNLFSKSLPGVIELVELSIVSIVFLQIADTLKSGKLMRSEAVINNVVRLYPRLGAAMNALFDATGAVLFFFLTRGAFGRFSEAWSGDFYLGNLGSFTAPTWPMELCVALGSGLMCILFITKAISNIYALFNPRWLVRNAELNAGLDQ